MKTRSSFSWPCHSQLLHPVAISLVMLLALVWTSGCASSRSISGQTRTPDYGSKLNDAAAHGNLGKVKALLKGNRDLVFNRSANGDTHLHLAAFSGSKRMAKLLLTSNAEVNARDRVGWTPLFMAVFYDHQEVAEVVLANKADV